MGIKKYHVLFIHPTKFTDANGESLPAITTDSIISDIGTQFSGEEVAENYFLDTLYYDSELEKENIKTTIKEVIVFTKIPKNTIKIPIVGGRSYTPDFAYIIGWKDRIQTLNLIVETKNIDSDQHLRNIEESKIKHAEKFFHGIEHLKFKVQFSQDKMIDLIHGIIEKI